jgi:hypothetical protein
MRCAIFFRPLTAVTIRSTVCLYAIKHSPQDEMAEEVSAAIASFIQRQESISSGAIPSTAANGDATTTTTSAAAVAEVRAAIGQA